MKRWFDAARARLTLAFSGRAAESRMDEELAFHVEMESQRLEREGIPSGEARRRALASFGGVTQHKETLRAGRGLAWLDTLSLDAKLALRMLRKTPGLTAVAVVGLSIAVAIGAVCFSAVYRIIDARLPVHEGDRVVGIRNIDRRSADDARATHLHFLPEWREAMKDVAELGAYRNLSRNVVAEGWAEPARVAEMTASGFTIARGTPLLGRTLVEADERPDAPPVAVIGHRLWQQRYAGRPDVVGRAINIGDTRHTIVGVMPDGFAFPVNNRLWIPLRLNPAEYGKWHAPSIDVFGRLVAGATIEDMRGRAELVGKRLAASDPRELSEVYQRVIPYTRTFIDNGDAIWTYHLIQIIVTLLLVVIGTNVAVLVYARTAGRMGELAIRTSLGASRGRIIGQFFAEGFALSLVAVVVGLTFAWVAMQQIDAGVQRIVGEQVPYWLRFELTPTVVLYAVVLGVIGAVIIGVIPAIKVTSGRVRASLSELSAGSSNLRLGRGWTGMIVAQVAIAVAVLPVAIAGIAAWGRAEAAQSRIAQKQILTAYLSYDLPVSVRMDSAEMAQRHVSLRTSLLERLRANPRVAEITIASNVPGEEGQQVFEADPRNTIQAVTTTFGAGATSVGPEFFSVVGIPLLAGRAFSSADLQPGANTLVVNQGFMKKHFGGALAVGARVRIAPKQSVVADTGKRAPWRTIVGVVGDFPVDSSAANPRVYYPMNAATPDALMLAIRMNNASATEFITPLREATLSISPALRLEDIRTMHDAVRDSQAGMRLMVIVLELITLSTILLSAAGIYALMSFTITRRRREIGIRSALGAEPRRLLATEMGRVMSQVAIGIAVGIAIAGAIDYGLEGGWTGRKGVLGLAMVALMMATIGVLSALRPAIGALRIQPTEALRAD